MQNTVKQIEELAARIAADLKSKGWSVERKEAKLECGLGDMLMLYLVIQPSDLEKKLEDLVSQAHLHLTRISVSRRAILPQSFSAAPEDRHERVLTASSRGLRAVKLQKAAQSGRQRRNEE
jgi:hypothetical protein